MILEFKIYNKLIYSFKIDKENIYSCSHNPSACVGGYGFGD